jgi:hypothetical protein
MIIARRCIWYFQNAYFLRQDFGVPGRDRQPELPLADLVKVEDRKQGRKLKQP